MFIDLFCNKTKGKMNIKYIYIQNKKETNSFNVNTNIKYMLIYYINIYKIKKYFSGDNLCNKLKNNNESKDKINDGSSKNVSLKATI